MKKTHLFFLILIFLIFSISNFSYAWQGRMAGMADPFGLISDESDFLIHPSKIVQGKGVTFYGDYRFTYTNVRDWDYNLDQFNTYGWFIQQFLFDTSGKEYKHDGLLGAAFPLGTGRAGIFFQYEGMRGDYDGHVSIAGPYAFPESNYDLTGRADNFPLRFIYGHSLKTARLGGEIQLSYHQEKKRNWIYQVDLNYAALNYSNDPWWADWDLLPLMIPYDSSYYEALLKGSLGGAIGPVNVEFTLRGGFIFGGDNELNYREENPVGRAQEGYDLDGDVEGWRIGNDLWMRYALSEDLFLPFLLKIDYQTKTRDGDGRGFLDLIGNQYDYKHRERNFQIEVGGGVEKKFSKGVKTAAGIYYNYFRDKHDFQLRRYQAAGSWLNFDYSDYPTSNEHKVMLRMIGEYELFPEVTLRMGFAPFYGWVKEAFKHTYPNPYLSGDIYTDDNSLDGSHWGIKGSLGGTVKFQRFTLEPFMNVDWQKIDLDGDGERTINTGALTGPWNVEKSRSQWYIGGGFSIKF